MQLIDPHRRQINCLRLSGTDRCHLRCRYCMPEAGVPKLVMAGPAMHSMTLTGADHVPFAMANVGG